MVCLSCHTSTPSRLCDHCASTLVPAPDALLPGGIRLAAAFEHRGAARPLVHHLKYRGVTTLAEMAAEMLADRLPRFPLVPVPRALSRRLKHGIDPARTLAAAVGRRLDVPVVDALVPPLHTRRRAGGDHSRPVRTPSIRSPLRFPVILVDDVVTTGATVMAAVEAVGAEFVRNVAAASVVSDRSNLDRRVTSPKPGVDRVWPAF